MEMKAYVKDGGGGCHRALLSPEGSLALDIHPSYNFYETNPNRQAFFCTKCLSLSCNNKLLYIKCLKQQNFLPLHEG